MLKKSYYLILKYNVILKVFKITKKQGEINNQHS